MNKYLLLLLVGVIALPALASLALPTLASTDPYIHHFDCKTDQRIPTGENQNLINSVRFALLDIRSPEKISLFSNEDDMPFQASPESSHFIFLNEDYSVRFKEKDNHRDNFLRLENENIERSEKEIKKLRKELEKEEKRLKEANSKTERNKIEKVIEDLQKRIGWAEGEIENAEEEISRLQRLWSLKGPVIQMSSDTCGGESVYLILSENSDFRKGYVLIDNNGEADIDELQVGVTCSRTWTQRK